MSHVNEYCRGSRARRFTGKELLGVKHLPWVRADLTQVQTSYGFICSTRPAGWWCSLAFTGGWWQDSLHRRMVSMKGQVYILKGEVQRVAWKEAAGKDHSAETVQRGPVKKIMVEIQNRSYRSPFLMKVPAHLFVWVFYLILQCSILKPSRN